MSNAVNNLWREIIKNAHMKKSKHPIQALESHFKLSSSIYSMATPNDGLKYSYNFDHQVGTASWAWSPSGHNVTLYDYLPTMDSTAFTSARKGKQARMIREYGESMLVHEIKGHGSLSTRDLPSIGKWCNDHAIHPELLNIMEDARIEAALSAKRPMDTKSKGSWINHLGADVTIPKKSHGGDYGWRKAYWHRYNTCPSVTQTPEGLLAAFIWAEKIRGLEHEIAKAWMDKYLPSAGASFTPDPKVWGTHRPHRMYKFVYDIFMQCRKWKKYRTTESLKPLMMRWKCFFPRPLEGVRHAGGKDVIIKMIGEGIALSDPHGNPIDEKYMDQLIPTPSGGTPMPPVSESGEPKPNPPEEGKGESNDGEPLPDEAPKEESEPPEAPEAVGEHEKPKDALSEESGETKHDEQSDELGDGADSRLKYETHVVENPIHVELPSWVNEFTKRDGDFGTGNEKLPADFF